MNPMSSASIFTTFAAMFLFLTSACSCGNICGQSSGGAAYSIAGDSTKGSFLHHFSRVGIDQVNLALLSAYRKGSIVDKVLAAETEVTSAIGTAENSIFDTPRSTSTEKNVTVSVDTTHAGLVIYYPNFTSIDLVCGTVPSMDDRRVIMFCEAAFTNELLDEFTHDNIQCSHASGGVFYNNGVLGRNNGAFVYYDENWKFIHNGGGRASLLNAAIDTAAAHGGMGFCQEMFIHDSKEVRHTRKDSSVNVFRALCEIGGKLCVAESAQKGTFRSFINNLLAADTAVALYLDMGSGWNYSWYRPTEGAAPVIIHPKTHNYITNWVTFYH